MSERHRLRVVIYGTKSELNTFILEQKMIHSSEFFHFFKRDVKRYELSNNVALGQLTIGPDLELLDIKTQAPWFKDENRPIKQALEQFLSHACTFLQWEMIYIGSDYRDIHHRHTSGSRNYLQIGLPPVEEHNLQIEKEVPLDSLI